MLEKDLENLREEGEDDLFIQLYKYYALNFVSFKRLYDNYTFFLFEFYY